MVTPVEPPSGLLLDVGAQAEVVVVCVTYNSSAVIGAFLAALPAALEGVASCRVVVADNASSDGTPALVRTLAPWVQVVETGSNAGYAGAINAALRHHLGTRGVYVLNPDAVPSPGSVAALLTVTETDPAVGIAVPEVLSPDGTVQLSLRREPTLARALGEAVLGGRRASLLPAWGETVGDLACYRDGSVAAWATGAALFISRSTIDLVGEWDERFFLYSEETDYALRARDAGRRVQMVGSASVVHQGGDQGTAPGLWALSAVNRTRLFRKRHGRVSSTLFWGAVLLNEGLRALVGSATHRAAVRALLAAGPDRRGGETTPALLSRRGVRVL